MPTAADPVFETRLPLPDRRQGKVRDVYRVPTELGPDRVLVVATDRISAFDVVMPTPIPGKGRLLTETSVGWFQFIRELDLVGDHLISTDPADVPGISDDDREMLDGRMMLCREVGVVPIECVARGYLAGSGWNEYVADRTVWGSISRTASSGAAVCRSRSSPRPRRRPRATTRTSTSSGPPRSRASPSWNVSAT